MPTSERFARRLCDLRLTERYPAVQPFAVGADKIALASVAWSVARQTLGPYLGHLDFGLDGRREGFCTFETYPGAFVKLVAHEYGDYKGDSGVRTRLLGALSAEYQFGRAGGVDAGLSWACNQRGSPNAFDALLCALSAWDHVRWRAGEADFGLSTPDHLLQRPPSFNEVRQIRREGWILVRTAAGTPAAGDEAT